MTLAQWIEKNPQVFVRFHRLGAYYLPDKDYEYIWDLYHLDDYVVSSVSGGTIWLILRKDK